MTDTHRIHYCPGCGHKIWDSKSNERFAEDGDCCNPKCQGIWGDGCYHCHHPSFWPEPLYLVSASVKSRKATRTIETYVRSRRNHEDAVRIFTTRFKHALLVQNGAHWLISIYKNDVAQQQSERHGALIASFEHYATGATVYHKLLKHNQHAEASMSNPDDHEEQPELQEKPPTAPAEEWVEEPKPPRSRQMTQAEAREALVIYVMQQVEVETLFIIEHVVSALMSKPGDAQIHIHTGQMPLDCRYNEVLQHAKGLSIGPLQAPPWLERFIDLIQQIRKENDLQDPYAIKPD